MSFVLAITFAGCSDIDDQNPAGFVITDEQKSQTVEAIPERVKADLAGMYTMMGKMGTYFGEDANGTQPRDDDLGIPLQDKYFFSAKGFIFPANETAFKKAIAPEQQQPFKVLMQNRFWSWKDPESLKMLLEFLPK